MTHVQLQYSKREREKISRKCRRWLAGNSFWLNTRTCIWFATWSDLICFAKAPLEIFFCRTTVKSGEFGSRVQGRHWGSAHGNLGQVWTSRPSAAFTQVPVVLAALHSGRRQSAASAGYSPVGIDITVQMRRSMPLTRQQACIAKVAVWWKEKKTNPKLNWEEKERIIWCVNVVEIATLSRRGWLQHRSKPLPVGLKNDVKFKPPVLSNDSKCLHPVSGRHIFFCLVLFFYTTSQKMCRKTCGSETGRPWCHSFSRVSLQGAVNTGLKLSFYTVSNVLA